MQYRRASKWRGGIGVRADVVIAVVCLLTAGATPVWGQCAENNYYWNTGAGDWSVPANWRHDEWDPKLELCIPTPRVPGTADWVWIDNGGTLNITGSANAFAAYLDSSDLWLYSGSLTIGVDLFVEYGGSCEQPGASGWRGKNVFTPPPAMIRSYFRVALRALRGTGQLLTGDAKCPIHAEQVQMRLRYLCATPYLLMREVQKWLVKNGRVHS